MIKRKLKSALGIFLCLVLLATTVLPAFGAVVMFDTQSQIPIITISGDGNTIYDKDGNALSKLSKLFSNNGGEGDELEDGAVLEATANILMPFLVNGILMDDWEPYYENLQKEISELFGDIILDENGEASNGTDIAPKYRNQNEERMNNDQKGDKGYYSYDNYQFWYDWRLDPMEIADEFNDYIQAIKKSTGSDKVSIICRCLGTNVVCAYLKKYGTNDLHGVGFDGSVCMGVDVFSEGFSGEIMLDGDAVERIVMDAQAMEIFDLDPFIFATIDLVEKAGLIDAVGGITKTELYAKVYKGVISALVLSGVSYPSYWACVDTEHFDKAVETIFGEEGSEKRTKYAGLIEKITTYNNQVKKNIPDLLKSLPENGVNVGVIAKYGYQMIPLTESAETIADSFVSVTSSSFGATTGTIYEDLSDEYIASQTEKGLGKYISPDKQIDASTCIFPDNTWFVKGIRHSNWTYPENMLLATVVSYDRQLTVDDFAESQFMVQHPDYWWALTAMTEDNCDTEAWTADKKVDKPATKQDWISALFSSILDWLNAFLDYIRAKMFG